MGITFKENDFKSLTMVTLQLEILNTQLYHGQRIDFIGQGYNIFDILSPTYIIQFDPNGCIMAQFLGTQTQLGVGQVVVGFNS